MSENFIVGDIVRHINGGPKMTVEDTSGYIQQDDFERYAGLGITLDPQKYGGIGVAWFDAHDQLHRSTFRGEFLQHVIGE